MLPLVMFAMIGAALDLGVWYWVAYAVYAMAVIVRAIYGASKD